jgi:prefoldin subunit 5
MTDPIAQHITELIAERDALRAEVEALKARVAKLQETILGMYQDSAAGNNPYVSEED